MLTRRAMFWHLPINKVVKTNIAQDSLHKGSIWFIEVYFSINN